MKKAKKDKLPEPEPGSESSFQKFEKMAKKVVTTPKKDVDKSKP